MRYKIREKFWAFGDDFHIKDDRGNPVYFVDGAAFSWGNNLSFQDMHGRELAYISQKLLTFMPKYEIHRDGKFFAEVAKKFTWIRKKFTLDVPGPNDYVIQGSFWEREFEFLRSGRTVALVSKRLFSWTDAYGVDIVDGEDDVSILCTCIVIDQVLHDEER